MQVERDKKGTEKCDKSCIKNRMCKRVMKARLHMRFLSATNRTEIAQKSPLVYTRDVIMKLERDKNCNEKCDKSCIKNRIVNGP